MFPRTQDHKDISSDEYFFKNQRHFNYKVTPPGNVLISLIMNWDDVTLFEAQTLEPRNFLGHSLYSQG